MTSVDSNFNFLSGRPHGAGPPSPIHMRPPEPDPLSPPCGRHKFLSSFRDLGVTLDSSLTFSDHISNLTRSYFHLRRLRAIRKTVPISVFTIIVHAFVFSPIDYCNSLLIGLPKCNYLLSRLSSMPRDALLVFLVSLKSPLL